MSHQSADDIVALLEPLRAEAPAPGPYAMVPAQSYRRMSADGLRQRHAQQAAERPHAAASYLSAGAHLHLWTRRGPEGAPWVALATSVGAPDRIAVSAGYRVWAGDAHEAERMAADPARALAGLVTRHGLSYFSGTRRVRFLDEHVIEIDRPLDRLGPAEFQRAVALEEPPEGARLAVNVAVSSTARGATRLSWFFVLDLTAYAAEIAAQRR